jgi:superfamily II DNA/RNA helicase
MHAFRKDKNVILLATDVAARGLDVTDIRMVVNFDMPRSVEQYVHRIGRTARADRDGYAVTFFTRFDRSVAGDLMQLLGMLYEKA